jgi:hypothetical protein
MTLPVGTVIKYKDYPHGNDGIIKPYWFIIMGRTPFVHQPQHYLMFKTTAQLDYYNKTNGERRNNNHKILECKTYPCFERDCCIDFDLPVFDKHKIPDIRGFINSGKVEVKKEFNTILHELYNLAIKGRGSSLELKKLFHSSFNTDGHTGLNMPKAHDRDYYRKKHSG